MLGRWHHKVTFMILYEKKKDRRDMVDFFHLILGNALEGLKKVPGFVQACSRGTKENR